MTVSSSPKSITDFLNFYVREYNIKTDSPKGKKVKEIKDFLKANVNPLITKLKQAKKGKNTALEKSTQQKLLEQNVKVSQLLKELLAGDREVGKIIDSYLLEGLTGTYSSMPKARLDLLTPDHQPQAAILVWAAKQPFFGSTSNMAKRAAGRANKGYAINLYDTRHRAGRTFGSKGSSTKKAFITKAKGKLKGVTTNQEKRNITVKLISKELSEDVKAMKSVANKKYSNKVWADIRELPISSDEKKKLVGTIRSNILSGEDQIANQDLNSLKS